jgi:hypothetical protein
MDADESLSLILREDSAKRFCSMFIIKVKYAKASIFIGLSAITGSRTERSLKGLFAF